MFDVGFWELIIISIVALLVVGPEKLPGLARDAGRWLAAARRFVRKTRQDIESELHIDANERLSARITDLDDLMQIAPDKQEKADSTNKHSV